MTYPEIQPGQFGTTAGLWHLNGNSTDSSGNNNHCNLPETAITFSQDNGKFGQGAGFNGTSSLMSINSNAGLSPVKFTVMAWIKTSAAGAYREIFESYYQNTTIAGFEFRMDNANKLQLVSGNNTNQILGSGYQQVSSTKSINDGVWHFVTGTSDGTNLKVYIDGNLDGTQAWANDPVYDSGNNRVRIGVNNYGGDTHVSYWSGSIDEVCLVSSALTAKQIRQIYAYQKGLLGRYA